MKSQPPLVATPSFAGSFGVPRPDPSARRTGGSASILELWRAPAMDELAMRGPAPGPLCTPAYPRGTPGEEHAPSIACRRIAILAVNPWNYGGLLQPFSYAAFRVQAALAVDPRLAGVEIRVIEGRDFSARRWVDELESFDPDVIGASAYVWSLPAFLPLLRHVKRNRPDVCTVLGGPSARIEMLAHAPFRDAVEYVDALVISGDETALADIAARWPCERAALEAVPGIAIADGAGFRPTRGARLQVPPDQRASPFQLGIAPPSLSGHLQTFTGCPMSCTFCAWGAESASDGAYSETYIAAELDALRRAGVQSVLSVDAGLNLHRGAFANLEAAERRVGLLRDLPYYVEVYPAQLNDAMLEFLSRTRAEIGIGLQSFNSETLTLSKRRCRLDRFEHVLEQLQRVATTTLEMILGLPGDTPQSFRATLERALAIGVGVRVYYCLVLPDALMTRAPESFQLRYDPVTLEIRSCMTWSEDDLRREIDALCAMVAARGGLALDQWATAEALPVSADSIAAGRMWFLPPS
jgi:radical SAM superfamily enzyme YgiQ (UPF0313 family)